MDAATHHTRHPPILFLVAAGCRHLACRAMPLPLLLRYTTAATAPITRFISRGRSLSSHMPLARSATSSSLPERVRTAFNASLPRGTRTFLYMRRSFIFLAATPACNTPHLGTAVSAV